jgi:hypothetical protein
MKLSNLSFKQHFDYFRTKISIGENFVFARYADGERMILNNQPILEGTQAFSIDRWRFQNNLVFSKDLLETCFHKEENYYYAISCKCCDPMGESFYRELLKNHNITFSNLFINANYAEFINFVSNLDKEVFLIANKSCINSNYPFPILEKYIIENDCVNWYENNKSRILDEVAQISKKYTNKIFFISAGPLSEILIHNLFINNPNNTYVDVGSSLDIFTHRKITRPYQSKDSIYYKKECFLE